MRSPSADLVSVWCAGSMTAPVLLHTCYLWPLFDFYFISRQWENLVVFFFNLKKKKNLFLVEQFCPVGGGTKCHYAIYNFQ